jgi:hypothetical protein
MQCVKLSDIIPLSEKDTTLVSGRSVFIWEGKI